MSFSSRVSQILSGKKEISARGQRRRKLARGRIVAIERLENRALLAGIVVTSLGDDLNAGGGVTLREAILAAETDSSVDGSVTGQGADTITFAAALFANGPAKIDLTQGSSFSLAIGRSELKITTDISIVGPAGRNGLVINSAASKRLFEVSSVGRLRIENVTLTGGKTIGPNGSGGGGGGAGLGGAVYNEGDLTIVNSTLSGNSAIGGAGSELDYDVANGTGGGATGAAGTNGVSGNKGVNGENGLTISLSEADRIGSVATQAKIGGKPGLAATNGTAGSDGNSGLFGGGGSRGGKGGRGGEGGSGGNGGSVTIGSGKGSVVREHGAGGAGGTGGLGGNSGNAGNGGFGGGGGAAEPGGAGGSGGAGGTQIASAGGGKGSVATPRGPAGSSGPSGTPGLLGVGGFGGGAAATGYTYIRGEGKGAVEVNVQAIGGGGGGLGGAIFNNSGNVVIINSTLTGNSAVGGSSPNNAGNDGKGLGGAVFSRNGSLTIAQSTISGNIAKEGGRGVYALDDFRVIGGTRPSVTINNTIIGQSDTNGTDFVAGGNMATSGTGNLIRSATGFTGSVVSTADPLLGSLSNNGGPTLTMALNALSPAINAGGSLGINTDQRGLTREGVNDIGAYEAVSLLAQLVLSAPTVTSGQSARVTVTVSNTVSSVSPIGTVTLRLDTGSPISATLLDGTATFDLGPLPYRTYSLQADFSGQGFHNATATGSLAVTAATPGVVYNTTAFFNGSPVSFIGKVTDQNGNNLANLAFQFYTDSTKSTPISPPTAVGQYFVVASFPGNAYFSPYLVETPFSITQVGTEIDVYMNPVNYYNGGPVSASGAAYYTEYNIFIGGTIRLGPADANQLAFTYYRADDPQLTTPLSSAPSEIGRYLVLTTFPDANSVVTPFEIAANPTSITLNSSISPAGNTQTLSFTANIGNTLRPAFVPTGSVKFLLDGVAQRSPVPLSGSTATMSGLVLPRGVHTLEALFSDPNGRFASSSGVVNFENMSTVVTTTQDIVNPNDGETSLREAFHYAESNPGSDIIMFDGNLTASTPAIVRLSSAEDNTFGPTAILVSSPITVLGPIVDKGVTIARDLTGAPDRLRLFHVADTGTLTLQNLTLKDGTAKGDEGVNNNSSGRGIGGAIINRGTLNLVSSLLLNNSASGGNVSSGNGSGGDGLGGALFNYGGSISLANTTFASNSAVAGTGSSNGQSLGGGVYNLNGIVNVNLSTLSGNTATAGAAIYNAGDNGSGAPFGPALPQTAATVTLLNSILANSTGGVSDVSAVAINGGEQSVIATTSIIENDGGLVTGELAVDPLLGPLAYNGGPTQTFALLSESPAVNAGTNTGVLSTDQRGVLRPLYGAVDIGAVEQSASDLGHSVVTANDGSRWYLGNDQVGNDFRVYRELSGQNPTWVEGGLAVRIGKGIDGIIYVQNASGEIYARAESDMGLGTSWPLVASVTAQDGGTWFLGITKVGGDYPVYREASDGTPVWVQFGYGIGIGLAQDGSILVLNSSGDVYSRAGSKEGVGTGWDILSTVQTTDKAAWFLGPDGQGGDRYTYRWAVGGSPTFIVGHGSRIVVSVSGTVVVQNAGGAVYSRTGSADSAGTAWAPLSTVRTGDGATWVLGPDATGSDLNIYRWATDSAPAYSYGYAVQLQLAADGTVLARNAAGNYYQRADSSDSLGTSWQLLDTEVSLVGGVLTTTDVSGGASNDRLTVSYSIGAYTITDAGGLRLSTAISGATGIGTSTLTIPSIGVNGILFDVRAGNDSVTIDSSVPATVKATLLGGAGNDTLQGGLGNDTLVGGAGNDTLNGGAGNDEYNFNTNSQLHADTIIDSAGIDRLSFIASTNAVVLDLSSTMLQTVNSNLKLTLAAPTVLEDIYGGSGNDLLTGNSLDNILVGGGGNDTINGGLGSDRLHGQAGDDLLNGGDGNDIYYFDTRTALGSDRVTDSSGIDALNFAASPNDVLVDLSSTMQQTVNGNLKLTLFDVTASLENLIGGAGNDALTGNGLHNVLQGGPGNDLLFGGAGNDSLFGQAGDDTLNGGDGDDSYRFDTRTALGSDSVTDSSGIDGLRFDGSTNDVVVSLATTAQQAVNGNLQLTLLSAALLERIYGGSGNDTLTGNGLDNILDGGVGNDALNGGLGRDFLYGQAGDDALDGGDGNDVYFFNTNTALGSDRVTDSGGIDALNFAASTNDVVVDVSSTSLQTVNSNLQLTLVSAALLERIYGGSGNDTLTGNALDNLLDGGAGNDTLFGAAGNDGLYGQAGNDVLSGGAGNDTLVGGDGKNILIGGIGSDNLTGGTDEDLLIGARYTLEADTVALAALRSEWASINTINTFDNRKSRLSGTSGGLTYTLTSTAVKEDGARDTLRGGSGKDWYLRNSLGVVAAQRDTVTDADGIPNDSVFTEVASWL